MVRKGMGMGMGKGYKNIIVKDPFIHSLSARGIKTKVKIVPLTNKDKLKALQGEFLVKRVVENKFLYIDRHIIRDQFTDKIKVDYVLYAKSGGLFGGFADRLSDVFRTRISRHDSFESAQKEFIKQTKRRVELLENGG